MGAREKYRESPPRTATAIRSSSVATITRVAHLDFRAFSQTYHIIGRPSIWARGFPGRRLAPYLAGMTTATPRGGVLTGTGGPSGEPRPPGSPSWGGNTG